jgi:hypothetical protein
MCSPRSSALGSLATLRRHWYPGRASLGLRGQTIRGQVFEFSLQPIQQPRPGGGRPRDPKLPEFNQRRGDVFRILSVPQHRAKREWETGPEGRTRGHSPSDHGDGTGDRAGRRSCNGSKECSVRKTQYRHNKCTVQVVVPHFAGGLGYQRAAVAGSAMKPATLQSR